jgi:hypothetical protein
MSPPELIAILIYLNFKIWQIYLIWRATRSDKARGDDPKWIALRQKYYLTGMGIAIFMIGLGAILSFVETESISIIGIFMYASFSLLFIINWFLLCLNRSSPCNGIGISRKAIQKGTLFVILFFLTGGIVGALLDPKIWVLMLFVSIDLLLVFRGLEKYWT